MITNMEKLLNNKSTVEEVLEKYLEKGFGSMNKNDFEVWIFSQLMLGDLRGKSNYQISQKLRIPEPKVKRLAYEAQLKYSNDENYANRLSEILSKAVIEKNGGEVISFVVEDIALRKWVDSKLKENGLYSDCSFNTEIVKLNIKGYAALLKCIVPEDAEILRKKTEQNSIEGAVRFVFGKLEKVGKLVATEVINLTIKALIEQL